MKNAIAGMMFLSLVWAGWAEPVEPNPTQQPTTVTTSTTTETVNEQKPDTDKPIVKEDVPGAPTTKPEQKKTRKVKPPLEIKLQGF